jgi:hypothetical protein
MATSRTLDDVISRLTDEDLMAAVGPATWAKGLTYFRAGRVLEAEEHGAERAEGRVRGSGVVYRTWIEVVEGRLDLTCACTVGRDCRHCVATVLELRDRLRRAVPEESTWRTALQAVVGRSGAQGEGMALLVDTHDPSQPIWLTPLRPGTHTRWATRRASWPDITNTQWTSVTADLNPTHVALLREGYRISRLGAAWRSPHEVSLDALGDQAAAWLRRLDRAGVHLLAGTDPETPLVLDTRSWQLRLDASADGEGLVLVPAATDGHTIHRHPRVEPATGLLLLDGGTRVAQVGGAEDLLDHIPPRGLVVPGADLAEFQTRWARRLDHAVGLVSTDGSFDTAEALAPVIVATVRPEGPSAVTVRWWTEYAVGGSVSRAPIEQSREDPDVQSVRRRIEEAGGALHAAPELWRGELRTLRFPAWRAPEFLREVVGAMDVDGLVWDIAAEVREARVDEHGMRIAATLGQAGDSDWFGLRVRVVVGGREVEMADLLEALAGGEDHLLVDGTWVALDGDRLTRLRELLEEARLLGDAEDGDESRLSVLQAGLWEEVAEVADHADAAQEWTRRIGAISGRGELAGLPVPASSLARLRPYQVRGHQWLTALAGLGLGGILADDMGLGKTLQVLSAVQALKDDAVARTGRAPDPVLVVAPTSVLGTWAQEAGRFFPDLAVRVVPATSRRRDLALTGLTRGADVVVTSYTIVRMEPEEWAGTRLSGLVVDEAQAVKNPQTAIHAALMGVDAGWRVAVTGTPVENSVGDLWSILQVTDPGLLPAWRVFNERFRRPIESEGDEQALSRLHRLTAPFILRRTKEQVAPDLPDKTETVVAVELGEEHRRIYDQYLTRERTKLLGLLDDFSANRMQVLTSIMRLRQLALDPALVDERHASVGSAKVELLADQLDQIVPAGHQVLVFSSFTSFLQRIRAVLERRGMAVAYLDGATRDRGSVIESFRSGERPVFLISLKAGGTGLTLTEADYVYVMDPWWNPAAEAQAVDRAHRIGQTKKVNVYRLAATGTIEEKVLELQERKRALVSAVVDGGGAGDGRISAEDLRGLLTL